MKILDFALYFVNILLPRHLPRRLYYAIWKMRRQ